MCRTAGHRGKYAGLYSPDTTARYRVYYDVVVTLVLMNIGKYTGKYSGV